MEVMAVASNRNKHRHWARLTAFILLTFSTPTSPRVLAQVGSDSSDQAAVARFYLQSGKWREARDAYEKLTREPNAPASAYSGLGEAYMQLSEREKSIAAFEAALKRSPDARAQQRLVDLLAQNKEGWPRATEILKAYLEQHPNDVARRSQLADLLISQSRIREAVPQLAEIVQARPQDADRRLLYARALAWTGQSKDAHPQFVRAMAGGVALQGEDLKLVALAEEAAGQPAAAYAHFKSYADAHPNDADALAGLARTAIATRRPDDADRAIQRLREMSTRRPDLAVTIARLEVARGRRSDALPEYERALQHTPDPALAKEYADILASTGRSKPAPEARRPAPQPKLQLEPTREASAAAAIESAKSKLPAPQPPKEIARPRRKQPVEAKIESVADTEADLRRALAASPQRSDLRLRLAQLLERKGRAKESLKLYGALRKQQPDLREAYLGPVRVYIAQGDERRARAAFEDFQQRFPGEEDTVRVALLSVEAEELKRGGKFQEAIDSYRQALELAPNDPHLLSGLAAAELAAQRKPDARPAPRAAVKTDTDKVGVGEPADLHTTLAEANKLKQAGKSSQAIALAHHALELDPDNIDAHLLLGGLYSDERDFTLAIAAYHSAAARRPQDPYITNALAGAYFSHGDFDRAASLYDSVLDRYPTNPQAVHGRTGLWLATAGRYLEARDLEAADDAVDAALALDSDNADALAMKAQVALAGKDWESARAYARQLPDEAQGRKISETLSIQERLAQWRADPSTMSARNALQLANRGRELDPDRGDFAYDQARAAELAGDYPAALSYYRVLADAPDAAAEAYAGQVRVLTQMKRFAEAEQTLNAYAAAHPEAANQERADLRRARAGALLDAGRTEEAFTAAREALALDPDDPDSLKVIAGVYSKRGQFQDAIATHRAVLTANPDDPGSLQGIAGAYEGVGDWESAEAAYRRLDTIPGYAVQPEVWERVEFNRDMQYAKQLIEAKRYPEARALVEDLRRRNPRDPEVWAALSEVTLESGADTLALTYADQGLALNRSSARLQAARIRALNKLGRFADARQAIASEQRTLGSQASAELARDVRRAQDRVERDRLLREGRLDQVYLQLAQEYRSDPSDVDTLKSIGFLYLQTKQYPEARQFFSRAQALAPQDADARLGLAYALRGSGNARDAVNILEDEYEARKDPELGLALAEMYHDLGRDDDAAEILEEAQQLGGGLSAFGDLPSVGAPSAAGAEAALGSILPPLKLPEGTLRARPAPMDPPARAPRQWRGSRAHAQLATQSLAFVAAADSMNDAAPAPAAAFAGSALDYLRAVATADADASDAPAQLAEELPSFERIMRDVRAKDGRRPPPVPTRVPTQRSWQRPRIEPTAVPRLAAPPRAHTPIVLDEEEEEYYPSGSGVRLEWDRRHDPSTQGVPQYADPYALHYDVGVQEDEVPIAKPLSLEARARAEALSQTLARKRAIRIGTGFRWDFLDSVADFNADQFAIYRFPLYVDLPAALNTRFRLTLEPTLIDNGRIRDAGVAGMATLTGLALGTDAIVLSGGVGGTPWGFPRRPYLIGFAQLDLTPTEGLTLTPFYERQPVLESLLSFRGEEIIRGDDRTFIGKVIQDRFGGRISFDTPVHINGVVEAAYSTLQAIRVPDNTKFDAFVGIGRTFDLRNYANQIRPGAELAFFHYDKDLSEPIQGAALDEQDIRDAIRQRRTGGGYFSPDAFVQALLRLDFSGPFFPETLGDATFLLTGKVGGQWISGVESAFFRNAEGGRLAGGFEGTLNFPIEEVAVLSTSGGAFFADPYNRRFFMLNLVFPIAF